MPWKEYLRRWDRSDRALVTAVLLEEALICSRCGTAQWQWDEEGFEAEIHRCPGCFMIDTSNQQLHKPGQPPTPGVSIRLVPLAWAAKMRAAATTAAGQVKVKRPKSPRERAREREARGG